MDPVLQELREAYASGDLIVFVGAGVSAAAGLPSWGRLVDLLIEHARARKVGNEHIQELRSLAEHRKFIDALSAAKNALGGPEFCAAIERELRDEEKDPPEVAQAIAELSPRLRAVLTTNIDGLLEKAFHGKWPVLARPTGDLAQRHGYILKLHGTKIEHSTWVFTREDYDHAMYANPQLAGVFTALFHSCPLLFVGYGLSDDDFDAILGRVRALAGGQPPRHFALMAQGTVMPTRRKQLESAGLRLIEYENADGTHSEVVKILRQLATPPGPPDSGQGTSGALQSDNQSGAAEVLEPLPGPPARLFGRNEQREELISTLLAEVAQPTIILGPAGIGKSTLSLAALHDDRVVRRFGARRFFVRCDTSRDVESLIAITAQAVGVPQGPNLRVELLTELGNGRALLVLDNLETPWWGDTAHTQDLERFLQQLGGLRTLGLIASVRGKKHPLGASWREPLELNPLGKEDSRRVFLAVAGKRFESDTFLERILEAGDGLPLAIELLAYEAKAAADLEELWGLWEHKRTELLRRGEGRELNLEASFELSINSKRMTPEARRLLSLLALLPAGLDRDGLRSLAEQLALLTASFKLRELGLAFNDEQHRLRVLTPLREYVARHYRPEAGDLDFVADFYVEMAQELGPRLGQVGGDAAMGRLAGEIANLESMVLQGLERSEPQPFIQAAIALGRFLTSSGLGSSRILSRAREAAHQIGYVVGEAICLCCLGDIAIARSQYEEACRCYVHARSLFNQVGHIQGEATCIARLGDISLSLAQYESARHQYDEALLLYKQVQDPLGEANCIAGLGDIALRRSRYEEALRRFEEALPLFDQVGLIQGKANCIAGIGEIAFRLSQSESARRNYEDALSLYMEVGSIQGAANCTAQLGDIAFLHSQHDEARSRHEEALSLFRQIGHIHGEAQSIRRLGDISSRHLQYEEACQHYNDALTLFDQMGDALGVATCTAGLGDIALRQSMYEKASFCYEKALPFFKQLGDRQGEATCTWRLGNIALRLSRYEDARRYYEEALLIFRQDKDVMGEANCIACLGDIALRGAQYEEARRRYKEALELFSRIPEPYSIGEAHRQLARASESLKEREQHVRSAMKAWAGVGRTDLLKQLVDEFGVPEDS